MPAIQTIQVVPSTGVAVRTTPGPNWTRFAIILEEGLDAVKLPFEFVTAEKQSRGAAMRAVVRIVRQGALGDQGFNFLRCEPIAGANRGVAGH